MKKKMNNKGFTLVELIVVLVILAILAAILVPTLMGYIDRARSEKDYATAQSVRVAAQSIAAEIYAKSGKVEEGDGDGKFNADAKKKALALIGCDSDGKLDGQTISIESIAFSNNQITEITVGIKGSGTDAKMQKYTYTSTSNSWEAVKESTTNTNTNTNTNNP